MVQILTRLFAGAALFAFGAAVSLAQPADYPSKTIRIVVPFPPGGSNDVLARVIADKLSNTFKQAVIVENKPGAGGNIGGEAVAKSPADGHTLLIAPNNLICMNPVLYSRLSFDPLKDFVPITILGTLPVVLVVNSTMPPSTVKELIAYAKMQPDGLVYGSGGAGTPQHLSAELFKSYTGIKMLHVPYKGSAPALADLLGGQIQMVFAPINSVLPHIRSGKLRALAVGSDNRIADLPEVPTMVESGFANFNTDIWISLVAPAKTPNEIVSKLATEVRRVLAEPEAKSKLAAQGIEAGTGGHAEMTRLIESDCARWSKLIRNLGIRAD